MNLNAIMGAVFLIAVVWVLEISIQLGSWGFWLASSISIFLMLSVLIECFVMNPRERRFFTLSVSDQAVVLHRGRFIVTDAVMMREAIVTVDVVSGPLLSKFGLAKLAFQGIGRFPEIPPLREHDAYEVQALLTQSAVSGAENRPASLTADQPA